MCWWVGCAIITLTSYDPNNQTQARAVRAAFPGAVGSDPGLDRPYLAAVLSKRLAVAEAEANANATAGGGGDCGAAAAAAGLEQRQGWLQVAWRLCDEMGRAAEWMR